MRAYQTRAGERGAVDDGVDPQLFREHKGIRERQPSLGVRVDHLLRINSFRAKRGILCIFWCDANHGEKGYVAERHDVEVFCQAENDK